jgi:DNA-directed RNA polymerase specialized sigma24 family protein
MKGILANSINRLGEREKIVITLYYYEGLTLAEIGQVLGVTEVARLPDAHQGGAPAPDEDAGCPLGARIAAAS